MSSPAHGRRRPTLLGGAVVLAVVALMLAIAASATKESNLYVWAAVAALVGLLLWALSRRPGGGTS